MADGGWKNEDDRKCGWKIEDDKIRARGN